jgi:hypothetical protein
LVDLSHRRYHWSDWDTQFDFNKRLRTDAGDWRFARDRLVENKSDRHDFDGIDGIGRRRKHDWDYGCGNSLMGNAVFT